MIYWAMVAIMSSSLRNYVREFEENIFSTNGQIILCKLCEVKVFHDKRYLFTQHIKIEKHLKSVNLLQNNKAIFRVYSL